MFDKPTLSVSFFVTEKLTYGFDVQIESENLPEWDQAVYVWPLAIGENIQAAWIRLLKEIGEEHGCRHGSNQWDRCPLNCDIDMPF